MKRLALSAAVVSIFLLAVAFAASGGEGCNSLIIRNATGDPITQLYIVEGYKDDLYSDEAHWGRLGTDEAKRYTPLRDGAAHCRWRIWVVWQGYEQSLGYVECTERKTVDLTRCDRITLRYDEGCYWTCGA